MTKQDQKPLSKKPTVKIEIDPAPKGDRKALGGSNHDQWNDRLSTLVTRALPVNQKNAEAVSLAGSAAAAGIVDMNPADPIKAMLISQVVVANEAALSMYRRAWACHPDDYFDAHTKYLQLADKASRTVAVLTERLDQHRNRGQQQIVVKHVTVNADQAVVTDTVVTGKNRDNALASPAQLTNAQATPMDKVVPADKLVPAGGA